MGMQNYKTPGTPFFILRPTNNVEKISTEDKKCFDLELESCYILQNTQDQPFQMQLENSSK